MGGWRKEKGMRLTDVIKKRLFVKKRSFNLFYSLVLHELYLALAKVSKECYPVETTPIDAMPVGPTPLRQYLMVWWGDAKQGNGSIFRYALFVCLYISGLSNAIIKQSVNTLFRGETEKYK